MKKSIFLLFLLISFSVITLLFFQYKYKNWRYISRSLAAFARESLVNEPIKAKNFPSRLELFFKHLKILLKVNSKKDENLIKDINLGRQKISFRNWNDLHVIYNEIFIHKEYLFKTKNNKPFIIDCGSNIGISVLFFKLLYPNAEILAFEPSNKNFQLLKKNIEDNQLKNIKLEKSALYNKEGKIRFYDSASIISKIAENSMTNNFDEVDAVLLSDYIDRKVDFLKMDIEGAEGAVFEDLNNKNKFEMIDKMIIEYHYSDSNKLSKVIKILEENNYNYQIRNTLKNPFNEETMVPFLIYAYKN